MKFDLERSIEVLSSTPAAVRALLGDLSGDWTASKGDRDNWEPFDIIGHYIYADYSSGRIWALKYEDGKVISGPTELLKQNVQPSSFGEDLDGELYLCDLNNAIYKLTAP